MNLRPRYSLLTLLVLTALVAVGVKLWYGPHHVVEEVIPGRQLEYTYTRSWYGQKIVDGPGIIRIFDAHHQGLYFAVSYFVNDHQVPCSYVLYKRNSSAPNTSVTPACDLALLDKLPLAVADQQAFRSAIEVERKRKDQDPGSDLVWFEQLGGLVGTTFVESPGFQHFSAMYEHFLEIPRKDSIKR